MVTFDICKGNPGALAFVMEAYEWDMFTAEQCFQRMERAGITGDKLYMLWNELLRPGRGPGAGDHDVHAHARDRAAHQLRRRERHSH